MTTSKLDALLYLLDDPDEIVFQKVEEELLLESENIIPILEDRWENCTDETCQSRIENIIQTLQFKKNFRDLKNWLQNAPNVANLFEAMCIISRFRYPDLSTESIETRLDKIQKSIWLEINDSLTLLEKTAVINHFLYHVHRFFVIPDEKPDPSTCFLNQMLISHKGNPYSMALFYTLLARRLEIPVRLIDFPGNPLVAVVKPDIARKTHDGSLNSDVIFYLNPSNKGSVTNHKEVDYHLRRGNYQPQERYSEPLPDSLFVRRLLEYLIQAYTHNGENDKAEEIKKMLQLFDLKL